MKTFYPYLAFIAGAYLQAFWGVGHDFRIDKALIALGAPLAIAGAVGIDFSLWINVFFYCIFFGILMAWYFRRSLAPNSNAQVVLSYQFTLLYVFFVYLYKPVLIMNIMAVVFAMPSVLLLVCAFRFKQPSRVTQAFFYSWHMLSVVCIFVFQVFLGQFAQLNVTSDLATLLANFFAGMMVFIGSAHMTYLLRHLAFREKSESRDAYERKRRYFVSFMVSRYDENVSITPPLVLLIAVGQGAFFFIMHALGVTPLTAINIAVIVPTLFMASEKTDEAKRFDDVFPRDYN